VDHPNLNIDVILISRQLSSATTDSVNVYKITQSWFIQRIGFAFSYLLLD